MQIYIARDMNEPVDFAEKVLIDNVQNLPPTTIESIYCPNLEFVVQKEKFIQLMISKLVCGGQITIHGTDLSMACIDFANGVINTQELRNVLFCGRFDVSSMYEIKNIMLKYGLKIGDYEYNGQTFTITGVRIC